MKVLFKIPFTIYWVCVSHAFKPELFLARKVWAADYPDWMLLKLDGLYGWVIV